MRRLLHALTFATVLTASPIAPHALAEPPVYAAPFSKLAVQGYDPVAYFTDGKPVKGSASFKTVYQGAEFQFSSAKNRDAFIAEPAKYAPQYGGYCAWAVAQGKHAKGDARYWNIENGKLYLNFNAKIQSDWLKDKPGFISNADKQWPKINK